MRPKVVNAFVPVIFKALALTLLTFNGHKSGGMNGQIFSEQLGILFH